MDYVAAIWVGMALLASVVSIKIALPVALVEILVGAHGSGRATERRRPWPDHQAGSPPSRRLRHHGGRGRH
jgi:hypothetical protein